MKKIDLFLGSLLGFLNGIFFLFILKQTELKISYFWLLPFILAILGAIGLSVAGLIGKKFLIIFQVAKFFLVGTLNTFVDIGTLNLLIWLSNIKRGIVYSLFKAVSFLMATTNSYFWNKFWTFEKREKPTPREFLKFLTVTVIGLGINVGVASFIVNIVGPRFGINEKIWAGGIAPIIAAFFAFLWNFIGAKFIVFKK